MANSENVVNQLLGAIDTVIGKRLEQLSYDKTIICTIIDDSKAKNGEYQVTDGSVKFWAKCENANYRNDEQVRVSVPNGDTTQEKFIIGKYVKDSSNTPITYMTPLDSVLKMSGDICNTSDSDIFGLQATGPSNGVPTKTGVLLWTADITEETAAMASSQIYDVIYIQADFKTTLSNYNITSGTYGLMLSLGTTLANGEPGPAVTCLFDSNQMLGNPYSFGIYTPQAAKFDITNVGKLSSVQLLFYQDGNFTHNTTTINSVPLTYPKEISNMNNILIKNIKIGFGADVTNVADETVRLFTTDDLRYDNDSTTNAITNEKHLKFAWYNKDENGQYIGFNDGLDASGNVKWVNEDSYLEAAGHNAKLQAQQNYDIPMDEIGLSLAAETKTIRDTLLGVSKSLSIDLHALMSTLIDRCNIASIESYLKNIDDYVCQQALNLNGKTNLTEVANDCYDWYMNALNQAAAKYNQSILPTQVSGSWTFKGDGTNPGAEPGYHTGFSNFFEALYDKFYPIIDEETQERRFLNELYLLVTGDFTGYKGIYDDYNSRITKLLNQVWSKWELIGNPIEETGIDSDTGELVIIKPLGLLVDNKEAIENYFKANYSFAPWSAIELSDYDNGYAIYWYRYNPNASGDNFMPRGWERVTPLPADTRDGIVITCDAVNMEKEEFKVLIIYNHEKYESNTLTFTNQSPVLNGATALLSDHITINHSTNSQESYQSYSVANTLINGADRYTKRELNVSFAHSDGAVDDKALVNAQVYWYIPKNATMLDYDLTDLLSLNTANNFTNDITSIGHSEMYREGYVCFYKTIGYGLTSETIEDYIKDLKFCYRIKNYYTPTAAQNTIYCTVINNDIQYHTEILMTFSSYGTSGTDYTLTVSPATKQAAITPQNIGDNAWRLNIALYDNTNTPVTGFGVELKQKVANSRYDVTGPFFDEEGYYCLVSLKKEGDLCDILEVSVPGMQHGESTVNLTTFFPIPYSVNTDYYIEGASTVVYDSQGGNPSYFKQPYKLFQQIPPSGEGESGEIAVSKWTRGYTNNPPEDVKAYLPKVSEDGSFLPAAMWVDGGDVSYDASRNQKSHCAYVYCTNAAGDILWSQPILIIQNRYPSPMLNAWDGKFKIDEENGTILSTMVSAGRKNRDNQFEGVLMGDIEAGAGFNPDNKSGLGIYGFNAGAQAFGFNIDGTAFLGKSGRGRILFDGNSGSISSASYNDPAVRPKNEAGTGYEPSTAGMMIDLDDGFIDMLGGTRTKNEETGEVTYGTERTENGAQSRVKISVQSPYFFIESKQGNRLLNIGDNSPFSAEDADKSKGYYFKTDNYSASTWQSDNIDWTTGSGMLIDLAQGKIDAYNFTLRGEDKDSKSYIKLSSSPEQMIKVFYRDEGIEDDSGLVVFEMGTNNYIMRSFNWWNRIEGGAEPLTGMEFNIREGKFTAYSSNNDQAGNYIVIDASDSTSNYPLMIGKPGEEAFKVDWNGALKINNSAFNIDSEGNFWVNGEDIAKATFSVNNLGEMKATSGTIGGWKITSDSLQSKGGTGAQVMTLGSDGSIQIGTSTSSAAFEVTKSGVMKASNYDLKSGKINTALLMKGKMRVVKENDTSSTITQVARQDPQLWVDGDTYLNGRILISPSASLETGDSRAQEMDASLRTSMLFTSLGYYDENNVWHYKYNGLYIFGASTCLYTDNIWIGRNNAEGGSQGSAVTTTRMNGNIHINANNDKGLIYFPDPERIVVRGETYTLAQYITDAAQGNIKEIKVTASTSLFATNACYLVQTDQKTKYDSEEKPVHFKDGMPVAFTETFATQSWVSGKKYATESWVTGKKYATESWVTNKGYLTSIPDDVVRDSDIADFVTSSTTSLTNYVLTSTYESKIEELEGIIETLQNEIETLKNNSSGGDSSTEES